MGVFEQFPYANMHEMNLDWLLKKMKELDQAMETFKATESLKFADPIIWDISTQYEKSTIVLDPTGNAYLSLKVVPAGIQLNNDEYWLEIFNFTDYTRTANQNLTVNTETNTTRATAAYHVDDWLIWNDVLYKVTAAIAIDDALIVAPEAGSNIIHFTVEDFIKAFITYATGLIQQYKDDIDASELAYRQQLAQDIADTTASLQAQLNAAISGATVDSEVINARIGADGITYATLGEAIRTQVTNLDNIDTQLVDAISNDHRLVKMKFGRITHTGTISSTSRWLYSPVRHLFSHDVMVINPDSSLYRVEWVSDSNETRIYANRRMIANTPFWLNIGYQDGREMTAAEAEAVMKGIILYDLATMTAFTYGDKISQLDRIYIEGGSYNPILECGNRTEYDVLSASTTRLRQFNLQWYHLFRGDTIEVLNSDFKFYLRIREDSGDYYAFSSFITGPYVYTLTHKGNVQLLVQKSDDSIFSQADVLSAENSIKITTSGILHDKDANSPFTVNKGAYVDGEFVASDRRICINQMLEYPYPVRVSPGDNSVANIVLYNDDGSYNRDINLSTYKSFAIVEGTKWKWFARNLENIDITNEELANWEDFLNVDLDLSDDIKYIREWCTMSMFPNMGAIGDSFTIGNDNGNISWPAMIGREKGIDVGIYAHGGQDCRMWLLRSDCLYKMLNDTPKDLYLVAMGINDKNHIQNGTLVEGTIADCHADWTTNPDTFYGSFGKIIGNVQTHAPNAKIIILSVARRAERAMMDPMLQELAEHFELPFIYLPDDDYFISNYYYDSIDDPNNLRHPTSAGYAGMAKAIERLVENCIMNNTEYFADYME